jgi:hypothetical protein
MSLRSKTQKAEKFGTPTTPTATTPKAPSPKAPKIIRTVTAPTVTTVTTAPPPTKPTITRRVLTQQEAGQITQETFRTQVQSLTASLRTQRDSIDHYLSGSLHPSRRTQEEENLARIDKEIAQIETEQHNIILQNNVNQILQALESGNIIAPDYFQNNITWVKTGAITQQAFLDVFYDLSNQGIIHTALAEPEIIIEEPMIEEPMVLLSANIKISFTNPNIGGFSSSIPIDDIGELQILSNSAPEWKYTLIDSSTNQPISTLSELINNINDLLASVEPDEPDEPDITITDNMVTQQLINFNIINGRAVGSIKFVATNNFNPYYYGHNVANIIQFKDPNGAKFGVVKENRLNFTETERDEVISYDEDMKGNTRATVESFVWSSATAPTPFSKKYSIEISEAEPPKPITSGFMGAGIAGAIAGLILIGFIAEHKRGK